MHEDAKMKREGKYGQQGIIFTFHWAGSIHSRNGSSICLLEIRLEYYSKSIQLAYIILKETKF